MTGIYENENNESGRAQNSGAGGVMRILVACEFSGIVREAFKERGHDAWSADLLPTEIPGNHIQGNVLEVLNDGWDLLIAHPPCTYLSRAAGRWLYSPDRLPKTQAAFDFVLKFWDADIEKIAIENPPGWLCTNWKRPDQKIHPYYFGEREMKETCFWLKNLPKLHYSFRDTLFEKATATAHPQPLSSRMGSDGKIKNKYFVTRMTNARDRSRTFKSVAKAMAEQWG